jgi:hypothetical protein
MTGACSKCGHKTATLPGTDETRSRDRRVGLLRATAAINGYRLGYVKENTDPPRLICVDCLSHAIPDSIAA